MKRKNEAEDEEATVSSDLHGVRDEGNKKAKSQNQNGTAKLGNKKRKANLPSKTVETINPRVDAANKGNKIVKSNKSTARLEKKKRKAIALLKIVEINEKDKKSKQEEPLGSPEIKKRKTDVTDEEYKTIKSKLAQKKAVLKNVPRFGLKFFGEKASLAVTTERTREPLMFEDIQYLLMAALLGSSSPFKPDRWCVFEKANKVSHTVILIIEGLSAYSFMANESLFTETKAIFEHQLEVVLPKYERNRIVEEISCVPLTQSLKEKLIRQFGTLEAAMNLNKEHHLMAKSVFPIEDDVEEEVLELPDGETFPRTRLLLSPLQMMIEGYPIPLKGAYEDKYREYRFSRDRYKAVTSKSPMFGLDCEMCRTVKAENELARVSIVDENYQSVYETLVRPSSKITNYLTPWSGITKEMMEDVTKTLEEVQEEVCNLLPPDAILVGQSLNCDLNAMKLMHPYVIDTSCIFNTSGDRNRKSKLQHFVKIHFDEDIQKDDIKGHSSIEDSTYSLKLTKLKLSKDIYFGDVALQQKRNIVERETYTGVVVNTDVPPPQELIATTLLSQAMKKCKKSAIVTTVKSNLELGKFYSKHQNEMLKKSEENEIEQDHGILHHKESTAEEVIRKTHEIILTNDFNMSHFNIFEDHLLEGELITEENIAKIVPTVDKWINELWNNVATNGLFVVIFGGHEKNSNGLSMIRVKK